MSKKYAYVIELNHVEDLKKALAEAANVQFNNINCSGFEQKIIRNKGFTQTVTSKPFIGLRQDRNAVLGFRIRSKSLADRLLADLHTLMAEKNPPIIIEPNTPHVTYHDATPDWEVKYQALVRDIIEASADLKQLGSLIDDLKEEYPQFTENYDDEN